jgi:hypothetical protein
MQCPGTLTIVEVGLALIAAGALMLWSARAYTDGRAAFRARYADALAERRAPAWFRRMVAPIGPGVRRADRSVAIVLASVVILAGCLRLLGLWS